MTYVYIMHHPKRLHSIWALYSILPIDFKDIQAATWFTGSLEWEKATPAASKLIL